MSISIPSQLVACGFSPHFSQQWLSVAEEQPKLGSAIPARVFGVRRGEYWLGDGAAPSRRAVLAGRLGQGQATRAPAIGDFVLAEEPSSDGLMRIEHLFEASSLLQRKSAFRSSEPQVLAANVDLGIVVCALAGPDATEHVRERSLNLRRIERYLVAIREASVRALVVVNKADLAEPGTDPAARIKDRLGGVDVLLISGQTGLGMDELGRELARGTTAVLIGSSGVGKSTLTNRLLERDAQRVQAERGDDARGRHTTTERALFALPTGALLIDTPGMRELGLAARDADDADGFDEFDDIQRLGEDCQFRDCLHESEPGCAVLLAIEAGKLDPSHLEHQRKLLRELEFQRQRHDAALRSQAKKRWRSLSQAARARQRDKRGQ